jgi:CHRD domain
MVFRVHGRGIITSLSTFDNQRAAVGINCCLQGQFDASDFVGPLNGQDIAAFQREVTAGNVYVNVHTVEQPAGLIRGQVATA